MTSLQDSWNYYRIKAMSRQPPAPEPVTWAVEKWNSEVKNRPLVNIHRRTLDDVWRQVIRYFGGDDRALVGPTHDEMIAASPPIAQRGAALTDAAKRAVAAWLDEEQCSARMCFAMGDLENALALSPEDAE